MAGAVPISTVGAGFVIIDDSEPELTIKPVLGRTYVCKRVEASWKQIIAEFADAEHAQEFLHMLLREKDDEGRPARAAALNEKLVKMGVTDEDLHDLVLSEKEREATDILNSGREFIVEHLLEGDNEEGLINYFTQLREET